MGSGNFVWGQTPPKAEKPTIDAVKIYNDRKATIATLLSTLNSSNDEAFDGSLHRAIDSLGTVRAVEGVQPLVAHLSFLLVLSPQTSVEHLSFGNRKVLPCRCRFDSNRGTVRCSATDET